MKLLESFSEWRQAAIDLVYPPGCVACGVPIAELEPTSFCTTCRSELALFDEVGCWRCGVPVPVGWQGELPCPQCHDERWHFDRAVAAGLYEGLLQQLILEAKGPAHDAVAESLADCLWQEVGPRLERLDIDAVVPVPMHWMRRWWRLANSPEVMAERLAGHLGVRCRRRWLVKHRHTQRQAALPRTERLTNLKGAFLARLPRRVAGRHILLVDDVLTTGATCSEAARVLKRAGAAEVTVAVVARTLKGR
jgi:ComF family protein